MTNLKVLLSVGVIHCLSIQSSLYAQNRYQYLFTPKSDYAGKIVKEYKIYEADTVFDAITNYNALGFVTNFRDMHFERTRIIDYSNSEISIRNYTRRQLISSERFIILKDSVLVIEVNGEGVEQVVGTLFLDSLNYVLAHKENNDTISTHYFENHKFMESKFYSGGNVQMIVQRVHFDGNSYVEKAFEGELLSMYNTHMRVDENTTLKIQEFRMSNGSYSVHKYKEVKYIESVSHASFDPESRMMKVFKVDSIFGN